jgi:hypothetical protein|tara:strand:+ start:1131 stop:1295 length:165 start_codon:yes stop_codon:yes gene_type:complete
MPSNNINPYDPPKEYTKPRLPKYEEPIVDWPSLIILSGVLFAIVTFVLLAISVS